MTKMISIDRIGGKPSFIMSVPSRRWSEFGSTMTSAQDVCQFTVFESWMHTAKVLVTQLYFPESLNPRT